MSILQGNQTSVHFKKESLVVRSPNKQILPPIFDANTYDSDENFDIVNEKELFITKELIDKKNECKTKNHEILNQINSLELKINDIVKNQHWKYMSSFEAFMEEIRGELLEKVENLKKQEKDKRKNENIHLITCERDFYKQESIRLNLICKEINEKNEELTNENKFLKIDNKNLGVKWKESEKINKHLLIELERNVEKLELANASQNNLQKELYL